MSKTMVTLKDGSCLTRDDLVQIISDAIFYTFGLKASKAAIKPKFCTISSRRCDDGQGFDFGYKCFFLLKCSDGRSISYYYDDLTYSVYLAD